MATGDSSDVLWLRSAGNYVVVQWLPLLSYVIGL